MGKPRGPISMTEARLANERGDKATVELFNRQYADQFRERVTSPTHEGGDRLPTGRESHPDPGKKGSSGLKISLPITQRKP